LVSKRPLRYRGAEPSEGFRRKARLGYSLLLLFAALAAVILTDANVVLTGLLGVLVISFALEVRARLRWRRQSPAADSNR
jgi:hypothetical protein